MIEVTFNKKFFLLKEKDLFIKSIKSIYKQSWINEIANFKNSKKKILIIHNIPLDHNLPLSPIETGYINYDKIPISINFIKAFMKILDLHLFAYTDENRGGVYRNLTPVKKQNMVGSHGSKNFYFHVDNPTYLLEPEYKECSLNSPEILTILGLRPNSRAVTYLLSIDEVINKLDKTTIDSLKKPIYAVKTPDSFDKKHEIKNIPILHSICTEYFTRYDYHNVYPCKEEGIKALSNFKDAISESKKIEISIDKGTMVIFKNQKILHARNEFKTNYDGYDRWLLRAYAMMSVKSLCHKQIILDER